MFDQTKYARDNSVSRRDQVGRSVGSRGSARGRVVAAAWLACAAAGCAAPTSGDEVGLLENRQVEPHAAAAMADGSAAAALEGPTTAARGWEAVGEETVPPATPEMWVAVRDGALAVSWSDAGAARYRVLAWRGSEEPHAVITEGLTASFEAEPGRYTVLVEAYDARSNSRFSAPTAVEVR